MDKCYDLLDNAVLVKQERKLCISCMETHDVKTYIIYDNEFYKDKLVNFKSTYGYCENTDMLIEDESQFEENSLSLIKEYEKKF